MSFLASTLTHTRARAAAAAAAHVGEAEAVLAYGEAPEGALLLSPPSHLGPFSDQRRRSCPGTQAGNSPNAPLSRLWSAIFGVYFSRAAALGLCRFGRLRKRRFRNARQLSGKSPGTLTIPSERDPRFARAAHTCAQTQAPTPRASGNHKFAKLPSQPAQRGRRSDRPADKQRAKIAE